MEHKKRLLNTINRLNKGELSVPEFRSEYYDFYLEEVPDSALSDEDARFFGAVAEKLDWTDELPDRESRQFGWINYQEFVQWVKAQTQQYLSTMPH